MEVSDNGNLPRGGVTYCDPCENEGCHFRAEGFCITCNDYLCSGCLKIHHRPVLWRYHELCHKQNMPKMKLTEGVKEDCIEPCPQHQQRILEYFCNTHDTLACSLCVFRKHRHCENVDFIPDVAESIIESEELRSLNTNFACLLKDIEKYKKLTEQNLPVVDEIQRKAVSKIVKLKVEVCSFLDKLLKDIMFISQFDRSNLHSCRNSFTIIEKRLKTRTTILEKKQKEKKMSQLFVDMKLSKLALNGLRSEIEKNKENYTIQQYEVDIDDTNVMEIQKCLEKIWKINKSVGFPDTEEEAGCATKDSDSTAMSDVETNAIHEHWNEHVDGNTNLQNADGKQVEATLHTLEDHNTMLSTKRYLSETEIDVEKPTEGHSRPSYPKEIRQYGREFLLKMQTCFHALHKPVGILDVPDIVFDEPQDFYVRWMKARIELKQEESFNFRPGTALKASGTSEQKSAPCNEQSAVDNRLSLMLMQEVIHGQSFENGQKTSKCDKQLVQLHEQAAHADSKITCKKKQKIYSFITREMADNYSIIDWIESNMTESQKSGTSLVNALINNVCRFSCVKDDDNGWLFYPERFHERKDLLLKFIGRKADLELEALQTVRSFVEKYGLPQESLREIYDAVRVDGIISEDTLRKFSEGKTAEDQVQNCSKVPSKVKKKLHTLSKEMQDDQSVIDWIECNVDTLCKSGTSFVNYLMTSVCRFSTEKDDEDKWVFHPEKIQERKDLLLKYIDRKLDLELEALYAVQKYIEKFKHPPGMLREAFDVLHGSGIVSKDAFFKWDTSAEKSEVREESLKQTLPFFTWLLTKDQHE